ncbi:hypothetical protein BpHYR1_043486 [Brachionus plicatilis]|uniref:Uncharacterized protein n=1 Tax=Brachionus plicatilis TaxID=10195 RepID=A0A3M7P2W6_BRAPC|nr:hypothetical protein BpHYR1_043486 [Brachionus plicatilis]
MCKKSCNCLDSIRFCSHIGKRLLGTYTLNSWVKLDLIIGVLVNRDSDKKSKFQMLKLGKKILESKKKFNAMLSEKSLFVQSSEKKMGLPSTHNKKTVAHTQKLYNNKKLKIIKKLSKKLTFEYLVKDKEMKKKMIIILTFRIFITRVICKIFSCIFWTLFCLGVFAGQISSEGTTSTNTWQSLFAIRSDELFTSFSLAAFRSPFGKRLKLVLIDGLGWILNGAFDSFLKVSSLGRT